MILRYLTTSAAIGVTLLSALLQHSLPVDAKKDEPRVSRTAFDNPLQNIFYFEDSDAVIGHDRDTSTVWRSADAGETWDIIDDDNQKNRAWDIWPHPWDHTKAYIVGMERRHWRTDDRGKTWKAFETQGSPSLFREPFAFHGRDSKKIIFHGQVCEGWICDEKAFYTEDDFESVHALRDDARGCSWAVSIPMFGEDSDIGSIIDDRIFCIVRGPFSAWSKDNRFFVSDNYFLEEKEVMMSSGRAVTGVINTAPVKSYMVAAATAEGTDEMALFVTHDASTWHKAEFGSHKVEQDAYTILESTNYSLQLDVMTTKPTSAMGVLFTSNSNGTYFTRNIEHTNRGLSGLVDFEKISGIQGIVMVNTVDNWKKVEETSLSNKKIQSSISFDDGRTFQDITVGDKRLHLHSVSDLSNTGRVFSSPAPGLVMGIGNTGDSLDSYSEGNLYVSDDAGVTWRKGINGPHKYEFGDQGSVLLAVGEGEINSFSYSINHGKDWEKMDLEDKVVPKILTTTPDSTSLKFLLLAAKESSDSTKWYTYSIDFDGMHERKCGKNDFEKWPARVDADGKPSCLMGHKQFYQRRKADADCFIADSEFRDPVPEFERCECTDADFECDANYVRSENGKECKPARPVDAPAGSCADPKDTFKSSSGWRLIPGNECKRTSGKQLDDPVERPCSESGTKPASGDIEVKKNFFKTDYFGEYYYLERTKNSAGNDEAIIMRTSKGEIFRTKNHGKTWDRILEDEKITTIYPHQYFNDVVYFLTDSKKVFYTIDRADTFHSFDAPDPPNGQGLPPIAFHPDYKDWLIWTGAKDCPGRSCHSVAHYTTDRGDNWNTLLRYVRKCEFIRDPEQGQDPKENNKKLVYCEQYENENPENALQLLSSKNWFADRDMHFNNILDFAVMSEFIIVAARAEDQQTLKVDASIDGATFADAQFPPNFQVDHQQAYTVLDSSTHAVFLHVTVNNKEDHEHGSIIKSNSNGTSYSMSLSAVNRDTAGYVDFEKMQGLEGVAMVNIVSNMQKNDKGDSKQLKTMITHNDGAEWGLITPPTKDADGKNFGCSPKGGKATDKCALHLHSYTERDNKQATFGSASAIGIMMAVGNVGENLKPKSDDETHTFITRDGGITWKAVKKGNYLWEYGDQGSVIVIVSKHAPTKVVYYTLDEGETWKEFSFSDTDMNVDSISTVPSDNSFNFLLWGKEEGQSDLSTVNLDFSGLKERERKCVLNEEKPENKDYYFWSPKHPLQDDDCLFGHVARYHRKKVEAECRNGAVIDKLDSYARNCTCNRQDYECDYNYERMSDGSCRLVEGLAKPDHSEVCKAEPFPLEFYEPTGYRRIPLTTCQGGREFDKDVAQPCPNRLGDYNKKYGLSGAGLFFAIVIPIAIAGGVGYWAWKEYSSGRLQGFGQIRLGEGGGGADRENPFIAIPVTIIAGTWAIVQATPLLAMSLWRSARGYFPVSGGSGGGGGRSGFAWGRGNRDQPYRSRASFANRRTQDYEGVVEDEDELLGDDLEDEEEGRA